MSDAVTKAERKAAKQQAKLDAAAAKQAEADEKQAARDAHFARYKMLRANVRRRRVAYVFFIILALAVFAGSAWDIIFNDSAYKVVVYAAYGVLFLFGFILLFSRRRHLEEVQELADLARIFLEDPVSGEIFQLSATKLPDLVGVEFSSPTSGEFYKLPNLDSPQVERVLPNGRLQAKPFTHKGIQGEVATFDKEPKEITFRAAS